MYHDKNFIVVLHPKCDLLKWAEWVTERTNFDLSYSSLKLLYDLFLFFLFEHIDPGC